MRPGLVRPGQKILEKPSVVLAALEGLVRKNSLMKSDVGLNPLDDKFVKRLTHLGDRLFARRGMHNQFGNHGSRKMGQRGTDHKQTTRF